MIAKTIRLLILAIVLLGGVSIIPMVGDRALGSSAGIRRD